ncbi:Fic family protein [Paenibacillus sp. BR2-3]|uniref:Fic family protein n=1 Tax=Paenibacillus sp. BR2-3 TaxID=3048494 RepID=UPI0039776B2E
MEDKTLLDHLQEELKMGLKGGLYHQTQIKLAYNSNRIEGSRLSEDQTRYIFETNTINVEPEETASVDDIIETVNHFTCFDYMLTHAQKNLSEEMIKEFHRILKRNTSDERKEWFRVGDYKARPNVVGDLKTTAPGKVASAMGKLLAAYHQKPSISLEDIVDFHHEFESIHPFQDGNGRVGRIIMFKECLKNDIIPFIIDHKHKLFYYRGLKEYRSEKGYLMDTCLSEQDRYEAQVDYFFPDLKRNEPESHPNMDRSL